MTSKPGWGSIATITADLTVGGSHYADEIRLIAMGSWVGIAIDNGIARLDPGTMRTLGRELIRLADAYDEETA